jgi:Cu+-exporting ATPase
LQRAEKVTHLVTDKTGTLTDGHPAVTDIFATNSIGEERLLSWAAALAGVSSHDSGRAVGGQPYLAPRVELRPEP